ncbi:MAG: ABC transporter permease [Nitrospinota bacterium]|nr:MAG: ABC transporter permease [Nitrospinota bacterium]
MELWAYILRRLFFMTLLVLGISIILFFMINLIGNPIDILLAERPGITPQMLQMVKEYYNLDKPLLYQYALWLWKILHLDFGTSLMYNQPVRDMLITWGWQTIKIQFAALIISLFLSIIIGVTAAVYQYSRLDAGIMSLALLGRSMPVFWLGLLFILVFSYWLGLFPSHGAYSTGAPAWGSEWIDSLWHMALPVLLLTYFNGATFTLLIRSNMVDVLRQDFILAARASGLKTRTVIYRHALRNAIIPVLTYVGIMVGLMLGSSPVTETVFTWPGLGYLYVTAITNLDYPVIMGITLVMTIMVVMANLLTDLSYVLIDPRIRLA